MNVRRTEVFLADVRRQYDWYAQEAGVEVADRYLQAIEATCSLLSKQPRLGPEGKFIHLKLRGWRFYPVFRPFNKQILFYEIVGEEVVLRRTVHGARKLSEQLL
jgi:toxin ParE1/3/4